MAKIKGVTSITRNGTEYWYARVNGKREYVGKGENSRKDAEEARYKWEYERRQAKRQGIGLETRTTEFKRFIDMMNWYMTLPGTQRKPRTYQRWVQCSVHLAKYFGKRPITQIEAIDLENYREKRKAGGGSDSSVDLEVGLMRMIYRKAKQNKMIPQDAGPGEYKQVNESKPRRPITDAEHERILKAAESDPDFRDLIIGLEQTSMRCGEIAGLKVRDVRFNEVISEVPRQVASYLDVEDIKSRKNPKERKAIPISDELAEVLRRRMEGLKPNDLVFTNKSKPWKSQNGSMSKKFEKICTDAEVPYSIHKDYTDSQGRKISGVDLHCYRVRRITKWAEKYNDSLVRLASGHKNPQIFRERYCKLDAAAVMALVGKQNDIKPVYSDQLKEAKNAQ